MASWCGRSRTSAAVPRADLVQFRDDHKIPVPRALQDAGRRRVIIVDDDATQLKAIGRALKRYADRIDVALIGDGIEALIRIGSTRPHLVVMDASMPGIDGVDVCRRLKANPATSDVAVDVKRWAQDTVLSMFVAATSLAYPRLSLRQVKEHVRSDTEPVLRNDADPRRLYLPVKNEPALPVCMAPIYPATHPRFSPVAIVVLTFLADVSGIEIPAVREVMKREHGHVYDAQELVLLLPG